jgi:hypothetical protein
MKQAQGDAQMPSIPHAYRIDSEGTPNDTQGLRATTDGLGSEART